MGAEEVFSELDLRSYHARRDVKNIVLSHFPKQLRDTFDRRGPDIGLAACYTLRARGCQGVRADGAERISGVGEAQAELLMRSPAGATYIQICRADIRPPVEYPQLGIGVSSMRYSILLAEVRRWISNLAIVSM